MKTQMKLWCGTLLFAVLATAAFRSPAQTQNFAWTVTGTGTETWTTYDLSYSTWSISSAMPTAYSQGDSNVSLTVTAAGTGTCSFSCSYHILGGGAAGVWIYDRTLNSYILAQSGDLLDPPENFSTNGTFTAIAGHSYTFTVDAAGQPSGPYQSYGSGQAQMALTFPDHYQNNQHTATRTASMPGNGVVSPSDGEKNLGGFSAPPQPQNGGTISGVTYTLTWNNPNVVMFFSDNRTATTGNPNANVIATLAPVPGQVDANFMVMLSNTPALDGTATMVWKWAPVTYAAGYQAILEQYVNGAWQPPTTNYTSTTNCTFTEITPGAPCGIWFCATNAAGIGPASLIAWPTAAVPPLPAQVAGLLMVSNVAVSYNSATMVWSWARANYAAGYQVVLAQYLNGVWQVPATNYTSTTNFTFNGVSAGAPCEVLIYGTNASGVGPASSPAWPTAAIQPIPALQGLSVLATNSTSIRFQLTQPLGTNFGVSGYYVGGGVTNNCGAGPGAQMWDVAPLKPSTAYAFYFAMRDMPHLANGPYVITNVTTLPVPTLQGLTVASINATSVRFELPQALSTNYGVGGYYAHGTITNTFGAGAGPSMWLISPLQSNTLYTFYFYERDLVNNMNGPTVSTNATTLATPIMVPALQGLSVIATNATSIRFKLAQPLPTNFGISGYYVSGGVTNLCGAGSGAQIWDVVSLQPRTAYTFYFSDYDMVNWVNGPYTITNVTTSVLGYNTISNQMMSGGKIRLSYVGDAGTNYVLERSYSLMPANWVPQFTNPADANGNLLFTNTPNVNTNNFWRVRSLR